MKRQIFLKIVDLRIIFLGWGSGIGKLSVQCFAKYGIRRHVMSLVPSEKLYSTALCKRDGINLEGASTRDTEPRVDPTLSLTIRDGLQSIGEMFLQLGW